MHLLTVLSFLGKVPWSEISHAMPPVFKAARETRNHVKTDEEVGRLSEWVKQLEMVSQGLVRDCRLMAAGLIIVPVISLVSLGMGIVLLMR